MSAGPAERPRRERRSGPIVMVLPLLSVLIALLWMHDRRPDPGPRALPPAEGAVHDVDGYAGLLELADGVRVVASLTRLHADPERQRFDALALGARLARAWPDAAPDGEPWRLSLRLAAPTGAPVGEGGEGRDDLREGAQSALAIEHLSVTDGEGPALATPPRRSVAADAVADPLLALLAPPRGLLRVGETLDVFLWGRAPGDAPLLLGLADPAAEGAAAAPLALVRRALPSSGAGGSLARLERGGGPR